MGTATLEILVTARNLAKKTFDEIRHTINSFRIGFRDASFESSNAFVKMGQSARSAGKFFARFNMNILSFIFAGMAMQRFFGGFLRSIYNVFEQVGNYQSAVHQGVMRVTAAFAYLGFVLINSLNQSPLFKTVIDFIVNLVNWFSKFLAQHPKIAGFIVGFATMGFVVGTLLLAFGTFLEIVYALGVGFIWLLEKAFFIFPYIKKLAIGVFTAIGSAINWLAANPVVLLVLALAGIAFVLYKATKHFGDFKTAVGIVFYTLIGWALKAYEYLSRFVLGIIIDIESALVSLFRQLSKLPLIGGMFKFANEAMTSAVSFVVGKNEGLLDAAYGWLNNSWMGQAAERGREVGPMTMNDFLPDFMKSGSKENQTSPMPTEGATTNVNINVEGNLIHQDDLMEKVNDYMKTFEGYMSSPQRA